MHHRRSVRRGMICCLFALPTIARAQLDKPAARPLYVGFTMGSLGIGVEASRLVAGRIALRAGASGIGFSASDLPVIEDVSMTGTVRLMGAHAFADLYPFGGASFHFSGGIVAVTGRVQLHAETEAATITLNETTYPPGAVGRLDASVNSPSVMPYAGIGFGRPARYGFAFMPSADMGVAFGRSMATFHAENQNRNPQLAADLGAEQRSLQDNLNKFPFFPVFTMAFGWRF